MLGSGSLRTEVAFIGGVGLGILSAGGSSKSGIVLDGGGGGATAGEKDGGKDTGGKERGGGKGGGSGQGDAEDKSNEHEHDLSSDELRESASDAGGASDDDEGDLLDVLLSERPIFTAFFETPREVRRSGGE